MTLNHIHIFYNRNTAFADDGVLQEKVIIYWIKGTKQVQVTITFSHYTDFRTDPDSGQVTVTDMTLSKVELSRIINPADGQKFIHIAVAPGEQQIIDHPAPFLSTLEHLDVHVRTDPVVNFRMKDHMRNEHTLGSVPLLFPQHLNGGVHCPLDGKKPNAIQVTESSRPWFWANVVFSKLQTFNSKQEKRRIVAMLQDSSLPGKLIGFVK